MSQIMDIQATIMTSQLQGLEQMGQLLVLPSNVSDWSCVDTVGFLINKA